MPRKVNPYTRTYDVQLAGLLEAGASANEICCYLLLVRRPIDKANPHVHWLKAEWAAQALGLSPEAVSKALGRLTKRRFIDATGTPKTVLSRTSRGHNKRSAEYLDNLGAAIGTKMYPRNEVQNVPTDEPEDKPLDVPKQSESDTQEGCHAWQATDTQEGCHAWQATEDVENTPHERGKGATHGRLKGATHGTPEDIKERRCKKGDATPPASRRVARPNDSQLECSTSDNVSVGTGGLSKTRHHSNLDPAEPNPQRDDRAGVAAQEGRGARATHDERMERHPSAAVVGDEARYLDLLARLSNGDLTPGQKSEFHDLHRRYATTRRS